MHGSLTTADPDPARRCPEGPPCGLRTGSSGRVYKFNTGDGRVYDRVGERGIQRLPVIITVRPARGLRAALVLSIANCFSMAVLPGRGGPSTANPDGLRLQWEPEVRTLVDHTFAGVRICTSALANATMHAEGMKNTTELVPADQVRAPA
jgi:hypothetical protein